MNDRDGWIMRYCTVQYNISQQHWSYGDVDEGSLYSNGCLYIYGITSLVKWNEEAQKHAKEQNKNQKTCYPYKRTNSQWCNW